MQTFQQVGGVTKNIFYILLATADNVSELDKTQQPILGGWVDVGTMNNLF